jgi:hypothetical protein
MALESSQRMESGVKVVPERQVQLVRQRQVQVWFGLLAQQGLFL